MLPAQSPSPAGPLWASSLTSGWLPHKEPPGSLQPPRKRLPFPARPNPGLGKRNPSRRSWGSGERPASRKEESAFESVPRGGNWDPSLMPWGSVAVLPPAWDGLGVCGGMWGSTQPQLKQPDLVAGPTPAAPAEYCLLPLGCAQAPSVPCPFLRGGECLHGE